MKIPWTPDYFNKELCRWYLFKSTPKCFVTRMILQAADVGIEQTEEISLITCECWGDISKCPYFKVSFNDFGPIEDLCLENNDVSPEDLLEHEDNDVDNKYQKEDEHENETEGEEAREDEHGSGVEVGDEGMDEKEYEEMYDEVYESEDEYEGEHDGFYVNKAEVEFITIRPDEGGYFCDAAFIIADENLDSIKTHFSPGAESEIKKQKSLLVPPLVPGEFVQTGGGGSGFPYLYHVVTSLNVYDNAQNILSVILNALKDADEKGCRSIAIFEIFNKDQYDDYILQSIAGMVKEIKSMSWKNIEIIFIQISEDSTEGVA